LEDIQKLIKVVKIVSDHPYPWHSGSPETASGGSTKQKNSNRSGGAHKSESQTPQSKIKTLVLTVFLKLMKYLSQHREGIFF
jgi:ATP-dependent RNA helicase RhlE